MSRPAVILVHPQISQNIGKAARAMLNFGLTDLRLVAPQADHLSQDARALSAKADNVLDNAKVYGTTKEAVADLHRLYATTARHRDMVALHTTPKEAASLIAGQQTEGQKVGLLFGPEYAGLTNEDVALCDATISVPLNPDFNSLNLAQAVVILAYEIFQAQEHTPATALFQGNSPLATREELSGFLNHLIGDLDKSGYFRAENKRAKMIQTIHTLFSRVPYTSQEVRTLRGIISDLVTPNRKGTKRSS